MVNVARDKPYKEGVVWRRLFVFPPLNLAELYEFQNKTGQGVNSYIIYLQDELRKLKALMGETGHLDYLTRESHALSKKLEEMKINYRSSLEKKNQIVKLANIFTSENTSLFSSFEDKEEFLNKIQSFVPDVFQQHNYFDYQINNCQMNFRLDHVKKQFVSFLVKRGVWHHDT